VVTNRNLWVMDKRDYLRNLVENHQENLPSTRGIICPISLAVFVKQKLGWNLNNRSYGERI
jgi:hypothetical protein